MHYDSNPIMKYRSFQSSYYPFVGGGGEHTLLLLLPSPPPSSLTLSSVILVLPLRETKLLLSPSLFRLTGNDYLLLPTSFCFAESSKELKTLLADAMLVLL